MPILYLLYAIVSAVVIMTVAITCLVLDCIILIATVGKIDARLLEWAAKEFKLDQ